MIPSDLAYGDQGVPPKIPGEPTLSLSLQYVNEFMGM